MRNLLDAARSVLEENESIDLMGEATLHKGASEKDKKAFLQKYSPAKHVIMYNSSGAHKIVPKGQIEAHKGKGWKTRNSLKAYMKDDVEVEGEQIDEGDVYPKSYDPGVGTGFGEPKPGFRRKSTSTGTKVSMGLGLTGFKDAVAAKQPDAQNKNNKEYMKGYNAYKSKNEEIELDEGKGLSSMTNAELDAEHQKVQDKINNAPASKTISMNHPWSQRLRAIRLQKMINKKQQKEDVDLDEEQLDEKITKSTSAGEVIKDFVKSDNPKFAGKSKEKRKQMALAAYYAKQRNEEVDLDEDQLDEAKSKGNEYTAISYRGKAAVMHPNGKIHKSFTDHFDAIQYAKKKNAELKNKMKEEVELVDEGAMQREPNDTCTVTHPVSGKTLVIKKAALSTYKQQGYKPVTAPKNEETEQIDEISAKTLGSYIKGASADAKYQGFNAGYQAGGEARVHPSRKQGLGAEDDAKAHKRLKGVATATNKLLAKVKEETEDDPDMVMGISEVLVQLEACTVEISEQPTYGEYLNAAMLLEADDPTSVASDAFDSNDTDLIVEAMAWSELKDKIHTLQSAGNTITNLKREVKDGKPFLAFVAVNKDGKKTKHVYHGNSRTVNPYGQAPTAQKK